MIYQGFNPLDHGSQLIDGVPTQEEIRIHQETNFENPTCNSFENEKSDSDHDMVSGIEFNDDSDTEWTVLKFIFIEVPSKNLWF